jgi:hypothetical protein
MAHRLARPIVKSIEEKRYVLGVAHPAGWRDSIAKGLDGARDYMLPDEVEKAAWWFARNGGQIGLAHVGYVPGGTSDYDVTTGHAEVVESYVYRGPDWTITDTLGNAQVIKSGDWLVGGILDEPTWAEYKAGRFSGWSVMGTATRRRKSS